MSKQIHFYESLNVIPANTKVFFDWQSTEDAIEELHLDEIHTTQMCQLSTSLLVKGYDVFVHQDNGVVYQLHLKDDQHRDDYSVRVGQNLYGMWASNVFRVATTVRDYTKPARTFSAFCDVTYNIDNELFSSYNSIPTDIQNKLVANYRFDADTSSVIITTIKEA